MKRSAREPMTLDEIDALEDATGQRYELWHGEPVAMTGAPREVYADVLADLGD